MKHAYIKIPVLNERAHDSIEEIVKNTDATEEEKQKDFRKLMESCGVKNARSYWTVWLYRGAFYNVNTDLNNVEKSATFNYFLEYGGKIIEAPQKEPEAQQSMINCVTHDVLLAAIGAATGGGAAIEAVKKAR